MPKNEHACFASSKLDEGGEGFVEGFEMAGLLDAGKSVLQKMRRHNEQAAMYGVKRKGEVRIAGPLRRRTGRFVTRKIWWKCARNLLLDPRHYRATQVPGEEFVTDFPIGLANNGEAVD
jgi:hypothetical protein